MKHKTDLENRTDIINAISKKEIPIYRCILCSNISIDDRNWSRFKEIPELPKEMHYTFSRCDYCKIMGK